MYSNNVEREREREREREMYGTDMQLPALLCN